jgi:hypothetical protein
MQRFHILLDILISLIIVDHHYHVIVIVPNETSSSASCLILDARSSISVMAEKSPRRVKICFAICTCTGNTAALCSTIPPIITVCQIMITL